MFELRKSADRGQVEMGWLSSRHSFSFGSYYDPQHMGFSDLRVINEDYVKPNKGFDTHGHNNMEIITYILSGALTHQDSMGNGSAIKPGDVQQMSAGSGVLHSEWNDSSEETVHLLQIWILPNQKDVTPRYQQTHFTDEQKRGKLCLIASPNGDQGSVAIYQDAKIYAALLNGEEQFTFNLPKNRCAYIHLARGKLQLNGHQLHAGDAVKIHDESTLHFSQGNNAEVLVFDLVA